MSLSYDKILEQLNPHISNIIHVIFNLNINNNIESDINKIKFSLFHILDGYLDENIGSIRSMQKYIIDNILYDYSVYYIIGDNFHNAMYKLTHFLYYSNKRTAFLYFGTYGHASMLHIIKNENSFDVTYINPGEGVIMNNAQYINNNTYCNMFNRMEVPNTHKLEFLMFIKVFIYFIYTPNIPSHKIAELDYYYCIEESFKYIVPKLCLNETKFTDIYEHLVNHIDIDKDINNYMKTIKNNFYKNEFNITEEQYNIDETNIGNPNIIYEGEQPLYFRLGDITIHKITEYNNIRFNTANIYICGKEYTIEDLYVPFIQNNVRLNNIYVLNPIYKHPTMETKDSLLNIINFNTFLTNPVFEPIKIDNLNFSYDNNNVNINDLFITSKKGSITNIKILNMNLICENFTVNNMKLHIPDDFSVKRMQMFLIDKMDDMQLWYDFMLNSIKNKKNNYKYLETLFTMNKPIYGTKEEQLYDTSVRFMDMYNSQLNKAFLLEKTEDEYLVKYYENALNIFSFHLDTDKKELLYKLFKSGTCVYMSFLGTIIYNYLQKDKPEYLIFIYRKLTESAYYYLSYYFISNVNYHTYFSSLNYKILSNKLNDFGILDETSRNKISLYQNIQVSKETYSNKLYTQNISELTLNILPFDELNNIIINIRNKDNTHKMDILEKYNKLICDEQFNIFSIYEFLIIGFLWEYYFNKNKWDVHIEQAQYNDNVKYSHISSALFTIAKCRIDVTYNECAWMDDIIHVLTANDKDLINEIELFNENNFNFYENHRADFMGFMNDMNSHTHRDNNYDIIKLFNYITTSNFNNNTNELKIYKELFGTKPLSLADLQTSNPVYNDNEDLHIFDIFNITTYLINYYKKIYENKENIHIPNYTILAFNCIFISNHYSYFSSDELDYIVINILKSYKLLGNDYLECTDYEALFDSYTFIDNSYICSSIIGLLNVYNHNFYIINKNSPEYYTYHNASNDKNKERCNKQEPLFDKFDKYPFTLNYTSDNISRNVIINEGSELLNKFHTYLQTNEITRTNINIFLASHSQNILSNIVKINGNIISYVFNNEIYSSNYYTIDCTYNKTYPLTSYLKDKKNIVYETDNHIIHILMRSNYKNGIDIMGTDKVIIVEKKTYGYGNYKIKNPDIIWVDDKPYSIIHDVSQYPFLASMPRESLCLFDPSASINKVIMLVHTFENDKNLTRNFVIDSNNLFMKDSYYCEFIIKSNYLLPQYNQITFNILDTIFRNDKLHRIIMNFKPDNVSNISFDKPVIYKPVYFDYIYKIVKNQINHSDELYNEIIQLRVNKSIMDLLTWSKMVDIKDDNTCVTLCQNKKRIFSNINNIFYILIDLKDFLCKNINFKSGLNMVEIMMNNITTLSLLMQINISIKNLIMLLDIIIECDNLACYKIRQLNKAFTRKPITLFDNIESYEGTITFKNEVNITDILFEIIFSEIITNDQWDLYKKMLNDYKTKTRRVYQLMMGKGKSSVITPLLFLNLSLIHRKRVFIIVPEHLMIDTINTYNEYSYMMYNTPVVFTDNMIKRNMVAYNEDYSNDVFLIDEFDSMYNPLQSNFNYVETSDVIDNKILEKVFKFCYNYYIGKLTLSNTGVITMNYNNITKQLRKYSLKYEIAKILLNNSYEKNITFGLSNNSEDPYVIPYVRKDSPLEGSRFSMYLITLILTLKYMWDNKLNKFKLSEKDLHFIFNNNKKLLKNICGLSLIEYNDTFEANILIPMIIKENPVLTKEFLHEYYMFIFNVSGIFKVSTTIKNISFIDIMNMNCDWMIGYSGTVNMQLNIPEEYPTLNKFKLEIIEDKDERINVYRALTNTPTIKYIDGPDSLFAIFKDYDVLIDCAAILKDYENNKVAEILYNIKKSPVIYVTKNDIKMIFDGANHRNYVETTIKEKVVYYYDQRHIVGTNFVQPIILSGLVTINRNSLRTNVAQAIYRMRKLNEGHRVTICYNDKNITDSIGIYKMIKSNEDNFNKNIKSLLYLQYLKYFVRQKTNTYIETDLRPIYDIKEIHNIFDDKITNNLMTTRLSHLNFNKIELKVIITLLKKLKKLSMDEQINLLFGTNTTETQSQTQSQSQINVQSINESYKGYDLDFQMNGLLKLTFNVYNKNLHLDPFFEQIIVAKINFSSGIILFIPVHLLSILFTLSTGLILIPIYTENTLIGFIIDCAINCDEYINIYPLYNIKGKLINPHINSIILNPPLQYNFKTMFADNISDGIMVNGEERYINFHEIFNINPELNEVIINKSYIENDNMIYLIALYKLLSYAFKFTNNNPVLLYKFTQEEKRFINIRLSHFLYLEDINLGEPYCEYVKELYKKQYLSSTIGGININDMHTEYPEYLLELSKYKNNGGVEIFNHYYRINRP